MSFGRLGALGRGFGHLGGGGKGVPHNTLRAGAGVFTLTGLDSALNRYSLVAGAGTFALTGTDMTPKSAYVVPAALGTFALTGIDATLTAPASATTTFDPAHKSASITLSGGNLIATDSSGGAGIFVAVRAISSQSTGKYYFEVTINALTNAGAVTVGIMNATAGLASFIGSDNNGIGLIGNGQVILNGSVPTTVSAYAATNIVGIAVDLGNTAIWFRTNNGNWNNSGAANPATNTGGVSFATMAAGPYFPAISEADPNDQFTANFGASAYNGTAPSGFGNW